MFYLFFNFVLCNFGHKIAKYFACRERNQLYKTYNHEKVNLNFLYLYYF